MHVCVFHCMLTCFQCPQLATIAVADPGGDPREQIKEPPFNLLRILELIFSNLQSFTVIFYLFYRCTKVNTCMHAVNSRRNRSQLKWQLLLSQLDRGLPVGCSLYTALFGQRFSHCSKVLKWTKKKYIGFLDVYHAPCIHSKHRYWVGLLLFVPIIHNLVVAMAPDMSLPVLSSGVLSVGLILSGNYY